MTLPLLVLAVPAILVGLVNIDNGLEHLLAGALPAELELHESVFRRNIAIAATILPAAGVLLAFVIYQLKLIPAGSLARLFRPLHRLLENKYYLDLLYERVIVGKLFYGLMGGVLAAFDGLVVDGAVNGAGRGARQASSVLKYLQTGQFQTYGALAFGGLLVTAVLVLTLSPL
jgi:NADH-quinone oxidoreductase subunit L